VGAEWVWLQRRFPWLGTGFIHAVDEGHADQFARDLSDLGFNVATMRPPRPDEFHDQLATALNFPDYYGRNWDATHDCFRDLAVRHPFALLWRDADKIASSDPKLFAEGASVLSSEFEALGRRGIQGVLIITGTGESFPAPLDSN
jgi:RNAse (barnase) inhibitor barstar